MGSLHHCNISAGDNNNSELEVIRMKKSKSSVESSSDDRRPHCQSPSPVHLVVYLVVVGILGAAMQTEVQGSFVTKNNNGFERLVVSIDDHLALPPSSSSSSPSSTPTSGSTGSKGATQECQAVLEQLKDLISRTSDNLYKATNGLSYFRQVSIVLPSNWATPNCTGQTEQEVTTATYQTSTSADITVTRDHPVYIDKPWTLQYGPCGVPGKRISIPVSFLSNNQDDLKARLIVREWIKLRYGVFDENGFTHDEKYPAAFVGPNGKPVQTACHLNRSTCADPEKCGEDSEGMDETHHHSSHVHDDVLRAATSMMSLPLDPNVNEFCNERTHIRTTPTKHNFLCDGRSIWEVMKQHEDFTALDDSQNQNVVNGKEKPHLESTTVPGSTPKSIISAPAPVFSYVTAKSHRMIFLLDRSRAMNQNNRWANLRRSLFRMLQYLPNGVELGVISYTNDTVISLPLTITTPHNRDSLHGRIPPRPLSTGSEDSCISCTLKAAVKLIKTSSEHIGPATLVLVNGSPSRLSGREWDKIMKIIDNTPLRVIVITYANANESSGGGHQLIQLAQYGGFYKVPDTADGNHNLEQNEILNNIFLQIISDNVGTPLNKVYEAVHWPDAEWQSRGKFTIEDSLGRNTYVTVTTEESGDVDGLQLVSPTGKEFDLPFHAEGLLYNRIPGLSEAGIWTYIVKFYQNQSQRPITVDAITESRKTESISVKFWNKVVKQEQQQTPETSEVSSSGLQESQNDMVEAEVVLLYAQVLQGELPVLNANVTATITLPGHPQHGPGTISVRLLDTGSGDPDITWGDGIYSAYFTQLGPNPGFFSVSVHIDDNNGQAVVPVHTNISRGFLDFATCCGSSVPHIATIPTGSFQRKIAGPSFEIKNGVPFGDDPYPPGRVTDLRVDRIVDSTSEVKLSWTAPGGDYDKGKAARYEIRCYVSREALTNDHFGHQGILVHSSLTPEPEEYGIRQSCSVGVPWSNEIFYYGIVSIDSALNRGKVSNLVSVLIKESPTSTLKIMDAWEDDALVSNLTSSRSLNKNDNVFHAGATWFRGLSEVELYIIIGGAAAFLLLVSTFILVLICVKRNKNKNNEAPPAYHNIYVGVANGKGQPPQPGPKDAIGCCWENESNSTDPNHQTTNQKLSGINGPYLTDSTASYIPASALCAPMQNGSIYRDMYAGSGSTTHTHTHDSSSVDSKPSDGGSNETVHVSDGHNTPASFYAPSQISQRNINNMNLSYDTHNNLNHNHNNLSRDNMLIRGSEFSPSDDDEGGFKSQRRDMDGFHKIVPMPSSEYDSPSIMNGSTYGGSVMSIPNSNKKRTRHISFV